MILGALSHSCCNVADAVNHWKLGFFLKCCILKALTYGDLCKEAAGEGGSREEPWLAAKTSGDLGGAGKPTSMEAPLLPILPASLPEPQPRSALRDAIWGRKSCC